MYEIIYVLVNPEDMEDCDRFVSFLKDGFKISNACGNGQGIIAYVLERVKNKK